jgi:ABC-2 type transport system ATP-binding protein
MSTPILEVVNLRKRYGENDALSSVSLNVEAGEIFGLLGPNGAGKTTLLSIICCLLEPTAGEVRLDGKVLHASDRTLRRQIGLVPQDLALYSELTARENLMFFGALYNLPKHELQARAETILKAMGLDARANDRVKTYSGGMKRRLNLGVALMHGPQLLLLDEPTAGVDPQSRNHIFEEARRLNAEGTTIIYTSHYMEEVQTLCRRVAILDHGKVVACDTLNGLLRLLGGPIRFRVSPTTPELIERLNALPEAQLVSREVIAELGIVELELRCRDTRATVPRLMSILNELGIRLLDIEVEEPSLQSVFLDLTDRKLRD